MLQLMLLKFRLVHTLLQLTAKARNIFDATRNSTWVFVPPHLGIEKKSYFKDHGHSSLKAFPDKGNFDWEERKERDESERQSAESQRIVIASPLFRLQYPVHVKDSTSCSMEIVLQGSQHSTFSTRAWPTTCAIRGHKAPIAGRQVDDIAESTVRRLRKASEGAVPSPSLDRHVTTHSHCQSSSSSLLIADEFGTGTLVPIPQSQSFSRSYGSILPTFLTYIVPLTRDCSPWRLDVIISTTGRGRYSILRIFKGRRGHTGHHETCGVLPVARPYFQLSHFQGRQAVK
ncbi:Hypothetical predicted protein [Olea europaea subsp. europaea]|uniref:Secreted protein n=1 Tax=Olea europaea subsp. europaea TaxID=158383 RepID=A0A8S0TTM0_OLEEU|nr:Hypothetical predicted protein [Olea europaea subsp. europaea]